MASPQKLFDVSVRDLLYVVFRHKFKIVIVALLVIAGVGLYTYIIPEKYTSEARILVKVGRESLEVDPTISGPTMGMLVNRDAEVRSEAAILESRELMEKAVTALGDEHFRVKPDEVGSSGIKGALRTVRTLVRTTVDGVLYGLDLKTKLEPHDESVQNAMDSLKVEAERNTNTIHVSFDAPGAEMAQQTLNGLIALYLDKHIDVHSSLDGQKVVASRSDDLKKRLEEAEAELESFRASRGIVDLKIQRESVLERINSLQNDGRNLKAQRDGTAAKLAKLEEAMKGRSSYHRSEERVRDSSPVRENLATVLVDLKNQEAEMSHLYPDTHRPLVALREKIANTQKMIENEPATHFERVSALDPVYQDLDYAIAQERAELENKKVAAESLNGALEEAQAELQKLGSSETELNRLQRALDLADGEYTAYRNNLNHGLVNEQLEKAKISNLAIVQQPTHPVEPSFPNKPLNIGLGILLGLFAGLCVAFLLDYLDDSINTTDRAERRLGVPVLAALSKEDYDACT